MVTILTAIQSKALRLLTTQSDLTAILHQHRCEHSDVTAIKFQDKTRNCLLCTFRLSTALMTSLSFSILPFNDIIVRRNSTFQLQTTSNNPHENGSCDVTDLEIKHGPERGDDGIQTNPISRHFVLLFPDYNISTNDLIRVACWVWGATPIRTESQAREKGRGRESDPGTAGGLRNGNFSVTPQWFPSLIHMQYFNKVWERIELNPRSRFSGLELSAADK